MTDPKNDLEIDEFELYDGTVVKLSADNLWVSILPEKNGNLEFESVFRVIDLVTDAVSMEPLHVDEEEPFDQVDYPLDKFREDTSEGVLFPMTYFYENRAQIREDLLGSEAMSIPEMVMNTWGSYSEFEEYGAEYVTFLIEGDIRELRGEMQNQEEIDKEFADIVINSVRALEEFGSGTAKELIEWRLKTRMEGEQDDIIERYTELWTGNIHDYVEFRR